MELNKKQIGFLNKFTRGKWTLNKKTGLVDIEGDFYCRNKKLTDFKGVQFGVVEGSFDCSNNYYMTSLEGAPQVVGGDFDCSHNSLRSLEGAPQKVGGYFDCSHNKLTSLKGAPQEVGESLWCHNNNLTSLEGGPQDVGVRLFFPYNPISEKTLELVWSTMQEKKMDYWSALSILKNKIPKSYWVKMSK